MQAVILAGGTGTRLKPFTFSLPKPLMPIGELPILEILLRQLARDQFQDIVISTGYLGSIIEAFCGDGSRWGLKIRFVREDEPLNTAGALKLVPGLEDTFLAVNGDILTSLNFRELMAIHAEKQAVATIAVKDRSTRIEFGVIQPDAAGFLQEYIEKPVYSWSVSMGAYVLQRRAVEFMAPRESLGMPDLLLRLRDAGLPVFCHRCDAFWLDIGRLDDYQIAQEEFERHKDLFLPSA